MPAVAGPEAAPIVRRAAAFLIDAGMQLVLLLVMAAVFSDLRFSDRAIVAGLLVVSASYSIGFVGLTGSTPGKMAMGMWVSDGAGKRVLPDRAILRYLVVAVPNLTIAIGLPEISRLNLYAWLFATAVVLAANIVLLRTDKRRRMLHDRIAGTAVVAGRPPELQ